MDDLISRQAAIDALHTWFRDGFDEDKWWNSTHVLAAIEGLPSAQQGYKWETCFECPLSHGCPKIKGCTNEQAIEYASQIPNDCPLSVQPEPHWIPCSERVPENDNEVLITVWDAEDDYVEVYKGFYQGHEWWTQWCHGCSKIKDEPCGENIVIAWKPLPEPYRGGGE